MYTAEQMISRIAEGTASLPLSPDDVEAFKDAVKDTVETLAHDYSAEVKVTGPNSYEVSPPSGALVATHGKKATSVKSFAKEYAAELNSLLSASKLSKEFKMTHPGVPGVVTRANIGVYPDTSTGHVTVELSFK